MSAENWDNLPTWEELVRVTGWILQGCPAAHRDYDAREMVRLLHKLMEGLPEHIRIYCWGAPEWKAELERLRVLRRQVCRSCRGIDSHIPGCELGPDR
jgi:hypothetical protein